ncbi:hypothetical protein PTTG_01509 [Puccinia triticina 1-1 BBBD Race 1]|uniref:SMP-30/Gluconolactonase/LRE-like region domain-containing protein n=2 Tax=Puccinia triticina TaxID=208348 RepID=A0A180G7Q3_PUCT1|nr:uncharacterized protein PtA15_10A16 [Puccinia triticina]OAV88588.1 hypothetical protein PTTG_01509 [Puccinia triticina 1-1 BBBD Race 1]WAQ88597.1 hypothetical protein PtA15_10A16 [Puccinia triticina]WAR58679.1 hypothetical protein PtB15_10B17 [Puccinia triticina]
MNLIFRGASIATLVWIGTILKPKIQEVGLFRSISNLHNERCSRVDGLEACEDIFVDQPTGLAYLACSRRKDRAHWLPAMNVLRYQKLHGRSLDYIALLDLKTLEYRRLELTNLPELLLQDGIHVHGLDLFVHPEEPIEPAETESESTPPRKATIYLINHRSPYDDDTRAAGTADSVIEVFETTIGSDKATHQRTVKHNLVVTPNNLVALNENSFYVTNDHRRKKHWTRDLELFFLDSALDSIVHCSFNEESVQCISALHGHHQFPNGIAKGPGNTIYMANSLNAHLRLLEIQPDNTLILKDEFKVPRVIDNLYVTSTGAVFIASIPSMPKFQAVLGELHKDTHSLVSPSEVWKFSNQTGTGSWQSKRIELEKVFADDGKQVTCTTGVAVWNSKLLMTGIASPYLSICEVDQTIAS